MKYIFMLYVLSVILLNAETENLAEEEETTLASVQLLSNIKTAKLQTEVIIKDSDLLVKDIKLRVYSTVERQKLLLLQKISNKLNLEEDE